MSTVITPICGVNLTATYTAAELLQLGMAAGDIVHATEGQEYQMVLASGAIAQYDVVGINEDETAAALTKAMADDGYAIGFAQTAIADTNYGWVALRGKNIQAKCLANCAADVPLYTSATAGSLDDDSSSQTKIDGVVAVTAVGGTAAATEVLATFPKSTTF